MSSLKVFWGIQWTFTSKNYCYASGLECGWDFKENRIDDRIDRIEKKKNRSVYHYTTCMERAKFTAAISCSNSLDLNEFLSIYSNLTRCAGQVHLKASRVSAHTTEDSLD